MRSLTSIQPLSNQAIGTVIAALLKTVKYKRAAKIPPGDNNYQPEKFYLGNIIPMSAILQESYQLQADVTEHAVESGVIFSDHVILRPLRLEVEFEVSNYDGLGKDANFAKDALDKAMKVWEGRQLFSLLTTHRLIENVVCLSIRATNEAPQWGRLGFRATFQQVSLATLQTSKFPTDKVQGGPITSTGNSAELSATKPGGPVTPKSAVKPSAVSRKTARQIKSISGLYTPLKTPLTDAFYNYSLNNR